MTTALNQDLVGFNSTPSILNVDLRNIVQDKPINTLKSVEEYLNMSLNTTANAAAIAPESNMVTYRFKSADLGDLFETFSGEQAHVALEGALNVIFGRGNVLAINVPDEDGSILSEDDEQANHEAQITSEVAFALATYQLSNSELEMPEDITLDPIYMQMEDQFRNVVTKLSNDIAADKENQDVITLLGEMEFFNRIELFNHNYDSKNEILMVTLTCLNS